MVVMQQEFLSILPQIASSPLAIAAYIVVVLCWLVLGLKVRRNREVLKHLRDFPEKDRLSALKAEMGTVRMKEGLSAEQYLKSKIHQYIFLSILTLFCLATLFAITVLATQDSAPSDPDLGLSVYDGKPRAQKELDSLRHQIERQDSLIRVAVPWPNQRDLTIEYSSFRKGDSLIVTPELPYQRQAEAEEVVSSTGGFKWDFPRIAVTLVNNTRRTITLNEGSIQVVSINPITEPLIRIFSDLENNIGEFSVINDGWGEIKAMELSYSIEDLGHCSDSSPTRGIFREQLGSFSEAKTINVLSRVPYQLRTQSHVCAVGEATYRIEDTPKRLRFAVVIPLKLSTVMYLRMSPSYEYDVFLESRRGGYLKSFPVHHEIKPGNSELFTIRVGTDRSVHATLRIFFHAVGGHTLNGGHAKVDILVPRTDAHWVGLPTVR